MDVVEIGRRDDKVQRSNDRRDAIQIPERETHARDGVQPGLACRRIPLIDREIPAEDAWVYDRSVGELGEVSAEVEHAPDHMVRLDGSVFEAGVSRAGEVLYVEPELA